VIDSKGRGDLEQVARAEAEVQADPARALRFSDGGHATLHAAGRRYQAVLTLIGGGVFGNPLPVIWEAILWAADQAEPLLHQDLHVVVNGRNLGEDVPIEHLHAAAQARGGTLIRFDRAGASLPAD
jgi:hypothetical protein